MTLARHKARSGGAWDFIEVGMADSAESSVVPEQMQLDFELEDPPDVAPAPGTRSTWPFVIYIEPYAVG